MLHGVVLNKAQGQIDLLLFPLLLNEKRLSTPYVLFRTNYNSTVHNHP